MYVYVYNPDTVETETRELLQLAGHHSSSWFPERPRIKLSMTEQDTQALSELCAHRDTCICTNKCVHMLYTGSSSKNSKSKRKPLTESRRYRDHIQRGSYSSRLAGQYALDILFLSSRSGIRREFHHTWPFKMDSGTQTQVLKDRQVLYCQSPSHSPSPHLLEVSHLLVVPNPPGIKFSTGSFEGDNIQNHQHDS